MVEVKTRHELKDDQPILTLERVLRNQPGWRFQLIIDGPLAEEEQPQQAVSVSHVRAWLSEGDELQRQDHFAAALLVLWSATERALRLLASREGVGWNCAAAGYVLKRLYTLGLLGREQFQILDEMMKLRNGAAHGFPVSVTAEDAKRVAQVLSQLLSEVEMKAA